MFKTLRACGPLALLVVYSPPYALAQATPAEPQSAAMQTAVRDGQHDFDFAAGTWHTHIVRKADPFDDKSASIELEGTVTSRKVWGGRAWLEEIEADGPNGHWQGMSVFLYNPQAHQWSQTFSNSENGKLETPFIGSFDAGRGELFCQETYKGRAILVKAVWSKTTADAHRYEEYFSDDVGKTWKLSFVANKTRIPEGHSR